MNYIKGLCAYFLLITCGAALASTCVVCHDDVIIREAGSTLQVRGIQTINHSVGFSYSDATIGRSADYVQVDELDSRIILTNGDVWCISCHELKDPDDITETGCTASGKQTIGPKQTDLCLACHRK